ncbi:MAG: ATP-binding protein [Roseiflexaceae bacterium]
MTPTLHIQLLGGFRLTADDAPGPPLDSPRLQALLAHLLLQRDAPHARAHLAFQLWPDTTESQAHANLRTLLHRLRQALPDADRLLHIDAQTVQWRGDAPDTLDVADFERSLAQAAAAEQVGDHGTARASFIEAVERYHGDLLPGWYDDWVLLERERLRQAFLAGLEKLVVLLEQTNEYGAAIGYAQRLLRHDPLHEATYQHLMRLHTLSGDRASAVRVYRTCATVLERELGVEPSPATHESYERVRHMEAQPAAPASSPTSLAAGDRRHNLPIALTSFIGRARERAEVQRLLAITRLLTLTGAGGCGKTRLALAVANELVADYPDGVWLVELGALADPTLVPQAVAAVLGVREELQRPLTSALIGVLQPRKLLLLLDNCEHLVEGCAQLATTLLGACPYLRILATSREALGVAGETTWLVPSLSLPQHQQLPRLVELMPSEAVELFVERAAAALPIFTLTPENAPDVVQVCQRLDGIPLAIELAAARVKVLPVTQIAARLDACFRLLTGGGRTAVPRHQSLRATIDWSYALLAELEQVVLRRLAAFAGGWTLEAAEVVCAGGEVASDDVLDLLAHLVDKSLVVVEPQASGAARYRLLETVRQYGWERLHEAGEATIIRRQHAHFFLSLAERTEPRLYGSEQVAWLDLLEQEHANLRAALDWLLEGDDPEAGLQLAVRLGRFWHVHCHLSEGRRWLDAALTRSSRPAAAVRAEALEWDALLAWEQADFVMAKAYYAECLTLYREMANQHGIAAGLRGLGMVASMQGASTEATALFEQSLALYRELGDQRGMGETLSRLALERLFQQDYAGARPLFEESLDVMRQQGDTRGSAFALGALGAVVMEMGDLAHARALYEESLALYWKLGDKRRLAFALFGLAIVEEQPERAARLLAAGEALHEAIGSGMVPYVRIHYERRRGSLRAQLDAATFDAAWAAGRAMSLEQAIAEAVANSP